MKRIPAWAIMGLMAVAPHAVAHGGGLDAEGCHHNRKTGDYHCHRAQAMPAQPAASLAATDDVRQSVAATPSPPGAPTCHVGPRGGTYTITSSGRKNYAGC